jgi:CRP-like cAMP-binding protein
MGVYRAQPGVEILREGEGGDFMLMLIEGRVDVQKRDRWNASQLIAVVEAGKTLGEMSMIDGEPRFASCVAIEATLLAVLTRENLARIIVEQPMLGAKILMELVLMLSQRLRTTSGRLLQLIDEQSHRATNLL